MKNIIELIENQLQKQKDDIFVKDLLIEDLKNQLVAAEKEIADLRSQKELEESAAGNFERRCAE